jgi:hypothetical protein
MPQTNGYELVKKIRNLEAEVRILLISAFEINHLEKEICQNNRQASEGQLDTRICSNFSFTYLSTFFPISNAETLSTIVSILIGLVVNPSAP